MFTSRIVFSYNERAKLPVITGGLLPARAYPAPLHGDTVHCTLMFAYDDDMDGHLAKSKLLVGKIVWYDCASLKSNYNVDAVAPCGNRFKRI